MFCVCETLTCPKNASSAVRFRLEPIPSLPFIRAWLSLRGEGRSEPASMYTPSAYEAGVLRVRRLSGEEERKTSKM